MLLGNNNAKDERLFWLIRMSLGHRPGNGESRPEAEVGAMVGCAGKSVCVSLTEARVILKGNLRNFLHKIGLQTSLWCIFLD